MCERYLTPTSSKHTFYLPLILQLFIFDRDLCSCLQLCRATLFHFIYYNSPLHVKAVACLPSCAKRIKLAPKRGQSALLLLFLLLLLWLCLFFTHKLARNTCEYRPQHDRTTAIPPVSLSDRRGPGCTGSGSWVSGN